MRLQLVVVDRKLVDVVLVLADVDIGGGDNREVVVMTRVVGGMVT